jgi:regulator of nucleoside diphosphate kinase
MCPGGDVTTVLDEMKTPEATRIVLPAEDYERLERIVAHAWRSPPRRALAQRMAEQLDRAEILDRAQVGPCVVTMNAAVCFREEPIGQERCVRLVYPGYEVGSPRRVSVFSPLGLALLGTSEGQAIAWEDEDGRPRRITISRVLPWPSDDERDEDAAAPAPMVSLSR